MDDKRKSDRRKSPRKSEPLTILVFWTGNSGRHAADMCDISAEGCYLNTGGTAEVGELITVEIPETLESEIVITISGIAVPQRRKFIGFGLKFEAASENQLAFLQTLMDRATELKDRRTGADEIPEK